MELTFFREELIKQQKKLFSLAKKNKVREARDGDPFKDYKNFPTGRRRIRCISKRMPGVLKYVNKCKNQ